MYILFSFWCVLHVVYFLSRILLLLFYYFIIFLGQIVKLEILLFCFCLLESKCLLLSWFTSFSSGSLFADNILLRRRLVTSRATCKNPNQQTFFSRHSHLIPLSGLMLEHGLSRTAFFALPFPLWHNAHWNFSCCCTRNETPFLNKNK